MGAHFNKSFQELRRFWEIHHSRAEQFFDRLSAIINGAFCKTAESWVIIEDKGVDLTGQAVFA